MANESPNKNIHTDFGEGWQLVRTITSTDTALALDPGILDGVAGVFHSGKAKTIELRIFSDATGAAPTLELISAPADGPAHTTAIDTSTPFTQAKATLLVLGTVTTSGTKTTVNKNPLTGVTDSTTWYEMSTTAASVNTQRVKLSPSSALANFDMTFQIDCFGDSQFYAQITGLSTANTVLIGFKRVE